MRCDDARRELLSGPSTALDAAAKAHVASCEACAEVQRRRLALDSLLDAHETPAPGPGFDTRMFARLDEERKRGQRQRLWRWAWALSPAVAAAAIALVQAPSAAPPPPVPPEELALMRELPMIEELELVQKLDEVEAYEALGELSDDELDAILAEAAP